MAARKPLRSSTPTPTRPRPRTQEERSASTRGLLLDATISCLAELGYAGTTTTEIADRAGVSRGAQLHHFPTKERLVTEAIAHLFARRDQEFRAAFAALPAGADRASAAVDLLWSMVSGPTFHAWLELVVAARTDAALRGAVTRITTDFMTTVRQTFRELFPPPGGPDAPANPTYDLAPTFTFALMQGLALDQIVIADQGATARVLEVWKQLARLALPAASAKEPTPR